MDGVQDGTNGLTQIQIEYLTLEPKRYKVL